MTQQEPRPGRVEVAPPRTASSAGLGVALVRAALVSLLVLALLILISAPAARGAAPVSGDQPRVDRLDLTDHTLDAIVGVAEAPDGTRPWPRTFDTPVDHLDDWTGAVDLCGTEVLFVGGVIGTSASDEDGPAKDPR